MSESFRFEADVIGARVEFVAPTIGTRYVLRIRARAPLGLAPDRLEGRRVLVTLAEAGPPAACGDAQAGALVAVPTGTIIEELISRGYRVQIS
jgi:hypothetical protein